MSVALIRTAITAAVLLAIPVMMSVGQSRTVGTILHDPRAFDGYTLFPPMLTDTTYLIDNDGRLVHFWASDTRPGSAAYLTAEGHLLHLSTINSPGNPVFGAGGSAGMVQEYDWDGSLVWEYTYSSNVHCTHHDGKLLPNGNVLLIAWEAKTADEVLAAGSNPATRGTIGLWPDHLIEVRKTGPKSGEIVWEWHAWDHIVQEYDSTKANYGRVADHPELIDLNFQSQRNIADWLHTNAVAYNAELDQVIISAHNFNEVWVIDHGTTTAEAAGHTGGRRGRGGDLLYRWGNPMAYRAGTRNNQLLFGQHDAQWIDAGLDGAGDILVFNNGISRPLARYSSIEEFTPAVDTNGTYPWTPGTAFGPAASNWVFTATPKTTFYSQNISGAQRLPNGNTLICEGAKGTFFEVTPAMDVVWKYISPVTGNGILTQGELVPGGPAGSGNLVFKIRRYAADYPGLQGRDLTPGNVIEKMPTAVEGFDAAQPSGIGLLTAYPNPSGERSASGLASASISFSLQSAGRVTVKIYNALGRETAVIADALMDRGAHAFTWNAGTAPSGMYFCSVTAGTARETLPLILLR